MPADEPGAVVVGGTAGLGLATARALGGRGPVTVTGRTTERAERAAAEIGDGARAVAVDLARPDGIAASLSGVDNVRHLVIAAMERDRNPVRDYDVTSASRAVTLKLVGYTEVVHALASRMTEDGSIVLLGGLAANRPHRGSATMTTVNGGISALVRSLATELAPIRANAVHPGLVGDSPHWAKETELCEALRSRLPTGSLVTTDDVVDAVLFLLTNRSVNGTNLVVDGGESMT
ncbi:SDR family oxidoreductase [Halostreptopolyspora alba]|uniref:SDR family oxidoreductase n=1 Tax=Halostreptopolyspora alba TaxID=2487137 RepID=A0A3N0ED57_9ACTN|nr:SDR family oxidoreductase [Nocardiopsaceae bacterium YIM 96095]